MSMHNPRIKRLGGLLVSQEYKCAKCQFYLLPNDIVELHHVLDDNKVRTGEIKFVHGHCHDLIHEIICTQVVLTMGKSRVN